MSVPAWYLPPREGNPNHYGKGAKGGQFAPKKGGLTLKPSHMPATIGSTPKLPATQTVFDGLKTLIERGVPTASEARANRKRFAELGPAQAQVADLVAHWTGGSGTWKPDAVEQGLKDGKYDLAVDAIGGGGPTPKLYRGMFATDVETEEWMTNLKAGDTHALRDVSSFSESRKRAQVRAENDEGASMLLEVDPGGKGLPIAGISNEPDELEWLMNGRLRITGVQQTTEPHPDDEDLELVHIVAQATWVPKGT